MTLSFQQVEWRSHAQRLNKLFSVVDRVIPSTYKYAVEPKDMAEILVNSLVFWKSTIGGKASYVL